MRYLGVPAYVLASSLRMWLARIWSASCVSIVPKPAAERGERRWYEQVGLPVPKPCTLRRVARMRATGFPGRTGVFQVGVLAPSHSECWPETPRA